jgi:hypothetical protein
MDSVRKEGKKRRTRNREGWRGIKENEEIQVEK